MLLNKVNEDDFMKKICILFISMIFILCLCSCKNTNKNPENEDNDSLPTSSTDSTYSNPYEDRDDYFGWPQFDEPISFPEHIFEDDL